MNPRLSISVASPMTGSYAIGVAHPSRRRSLPFLFLTIVTVLMASDLGFAVPPGCAGDYNDDGMCTDAADYVVWRKHVATDYPLPNDDGLGTPIDIEHYDLWRHNFRRFNIPGSGSAIENAVVVITPEPSGLLLAAVGGFLAAVFAGRRRSALRPAM